MTALGRRSAEPVEDQGTSGGETEPGGVHGDRGKAEPSGFCTDRVHEGQG